MGISPLHLAFAAFHPFSRFSEGPISHVPPTSTSELISQRMVLKISNYGCRETYLLWNFNSVLLYFLCLIILKNIFLCNNCFILQTYPLLRSCFVFLVLQRKFITQKPNDHNASLMFSFPGCRIDCVSCTHFFFYKQLHFNLSLELLAKFWKMRLKVA